LTEHQADRLVKARESIEAARILLREGFAGFSASRSYYAMFHTAEAILLRQDLVFSSHAAVHAAFGREFAKPGVVPRIYHQRLVEAFVFRQAGDYGTGHSINSGVAGELIQQAGDFLTFAENLMGDNPAQ